MLNIIIYAKKKRLFRKKVKFTSIYNKHGEINVYTLYNKKQENLLKENFSGNFYLWNNFGFENAKGEFLINSILKHPPEAKSISLIDEDLRFLNYATKLQHIFGTLTVVTSQNAEDYCQSIYAKTGAYPLVKKELTDSLAVDIKSGKTYGFNIHGVKDIFDSELLEVLPDDTDFYGLFFALTKENGI